MGVILFSGVHGVGKGFFLEKVKQNVHQYEIYSASRLIEKYQPSTDAGYKKVKNIGNNQDVLIKALLNEMSTENKRIILDGHLCIFNAYGDVERIPEYFMQEAQITGIVLLQDVPSIICERINQRDENKLNVCDIEKMQKEEELYVMELKEKYGINYIVLTHDCNSEQFAEELKRLGGSTNE